MASVLNEIVQRQLIHFEKIHPDYVQSVANALGVTLLR